MAEIGDVADAFVFPERDVEEALFVKAAQAVVAGAV